MPWTSTPEKERWVLVMAFGLPAAVGPVSGRRRRKEMSRGIAAGESAHQMARRPAGAAPTHSLPPAGHTSGSPLLVRGGPSDGVRPHQGDDPRQGAEARV